MSHSAGLQTKSHQMQKKELSEARGETRVSLGHQDGSSSRISLRGLTYPTHLEGARRHLKKHPLRLSTKGLI